MKIENCVLKICVSSSHLLVPTQPFPHRHTHACLAQLRYSYRMNRMWRNALVVSIAILVGTLVYTYLFYGHLRAWAIQQSLGNAAVIVIAPSLALSGLAYFLAWPKRFIPYRKSLGLLGFYLGLGHVGVSMYRSGFMFDALALTSWRDTAIFVGYIAVVLFALMPLITSRALAPMLGGARVRIGLRYLGYSAYALVIFHGGFLAWGSWVRWWGAEDSTLLLPPTLIAVAIGTLTLLLRVALWVATRGTAKRT